MVQSMLAGSAIHESITIHNYLLLSAKLSLLFKSYYFFIWLKQKDVNTCIRASTWYNMHTPIGLRIVAVNKNIRYHVQENCGLFFKLGYLKDIWGQQKNATSECPLTLNLEY